MQIKITKIPNFFSRTDDFPPPMDLRTFESLDDWSEIYDGGYGSSYVFSIVWSFYVYVYQDYIVVCHPVVIIVL
jgi:hypothetical protein